MAALLAPLAACTPAPPEGNTAGLVGDDTAADATDTACPELAGPRGLLVAQSWDHAELPMGAGAGTYRVIFLQESMYTLLPEIRAANPEARVFAYQKAGGMREDGGDHPSTGLRADEAEEA
jgi:hypothetical protein